MDNVANKIELSTPSRVSRVVVGSLFIGIVMSSNGQLGYLTILPLLAIYPILTGIMGEDPLDYLFADWKGGFEGECYNPSSRIALVGLGGLAVGAVMLSPENVGIRAFLALVSVYPILAGLFGEDLFSISLGLGRKQKTVQKGVDASLTEERPVSVRLVHRSRVTGTAHQYKFGHGAGPKAA